MYAVIETGGKQYRVSPGDTVEVELLPAEPGATVTLERVLLVSDDDHTLVGAPTVAGGRVVGIVAKEGRGPKIIVFRYKSKKRYRRKTGHRQDYTYLMITDIQAEGKSLVSDADRKRYELLAGRAAGRYETKLLAALAGIDLKEMRRSMAGTPRVRAADDAADANADIPAADATVDADEGADEE